MNAQNPTLDDEEDLHSVDEFAEFDPETRQWRALVPLPTPRSSHNAAMIGNRLYVVGGWSLQGQPPGDWQLDALAYDFENSEAGWQKITDPPFSRRALAASFWRGRLVGIGGIDENGDISQRVEFFEPRSGDWSQGPDLPGDGMVGFGVSACNLEGRLYASGLRGVVYRLNESASAWEEAGRLVKGRFFHQLLPASNAQLLAIGGASRDGHLADAELIEVDRAAESRAHKSGDAIERRRVR
jgi:N-acetylneuraminic acid mutarotase